LKLETSPSVTPRTVPEAVRTVCAGAAFARETAASAARDTQIVREIVMVLGR